MTSPRLYNTITLGEPSGLSNPFGRTTRGVFDIPVKKAWMKKPKDKQKTQGKEKDLGYMRHILFEGFFNLNQFPKFTKPADKTKVFKCIKSIRLRFCSSPGDVHYKQMDEIIARFTDIEKFVFAGTSHIAKAPLDRLSSTCKKGVVVLEPRLGSYPPIDWTSRYIQSIVYVFLDSGRKYHDSGWLENLGSVLIDAASRQGSLKTITIVNSATMRFSGHTRMTLRDYIARGLRAKHDADQRFPVRKAQTSTMISHLQYPTFEYLSVREYLRDNDWAGEFTDEEVKPWLDEEEAERAAKQLEEQVLEGDMAEQGV
jgi:hypothetical protein